MEAEVIEGVCDVRSLSVSDIGQLGERAQAL